MTPLALAIKLDATENLDICNLLKQYNPNPNISIINGVGKLHPLLHEAITLSSKEKVRLLLELATNPDVINNIGISALTLAASESVTENINEDIIDNLIEYGANLDFRPNFDFSKSIDGNIRFININALQFCSLTHTNIALKIIKTALSQGGLHYAWNLMRKPYLLIAEDEKNKKTCIYTRDTLTVCIERDNTSIKKLGRLMTNIVQIGEVYHLDNRSLYIDIVENNHEQVTNFFKEKSPEEICKIFSHKIQMTVSKHFEGLTVLTLANELQNISMVTSLKEIYSDALKRMQQQNKYQDMIKNECSQEYTLQRM